MKHFRLFSLVLAALMITSAAMFNSCSKQDIEGQSIEPEDVHMTVADLKFQNQLVNFRDKVKYIQEHPGYKSGELMSADSAILNIESLFNATYSFADERYGRTQTDRTSVMIDVNSSDEVLLDDMVSTFDEIINIATQHYYESELQPKAFVLLDLSRGTETNGELSIDIMTVVGEKVTGSEYFEEDDDWWYGNERGDCEWEDEGTDAAEELQATINSNIVTPIPPPGYRWSYSSTETIPLVGNEYQNSLAYYIFFIQSNDPFTWDEQCLQPDEMNAYLFSEEEMIYLVIPEDLNRPDNWKFISCDLIGEQIEYQETPTIHHQNYLTYGLRHLVALEIVDPPIEL